MSIAIRTDPVPLQMDEGGTIRVSGTRMTLDLIIAEHQAGASPEQIAEMYDVLSLPDIYAAITYYLRHRVEMDSYLEQRRRVAADLRREIEEKRPREGLRERLITRRAKKG
jgi:uncharacterized protein (DUF433 family)